MAEALPAYGVVQRIDTSTGTSVANGLSALGRFLPSASLLGATVDPRNQAVYVEAKTRVVEGTVGAVVGVLMAILGLFAAALWHPAPASAGTRSAASSIGVSLVICGALVLLAINMVQSQAPLTPVDTLLSSSQPVGVSVPAAVPSPPSIPAPGQVAPLNQAPPPNPTPAAIFYRHDQIGPLKVDAHNSYIVDLGTLAKGTQVRAVVSVAFNTRVSSLAGTPDISVHLGGTCQGAADLERARNGAQLSFQSPSDGVCTIILDNTYSRVNAKQVQLQFLQP